MNESICILCRKTILEGEGTRLLYGMFSCRGQCKDRVWAELKDYTRSKKGRHRRPREIKRIIKKMRLEFQPKLDGPGF